MSTPGPAHRGRGPVDHQPLKGGLIGIALVALATLGLSLVAAVLVAVILLLAG